MIIVFNHFEFFGQYGLLGRLYHRFLQNATFGVDYFFMLSGFGMMLGSLARDPDGINSVTLKGSIMYARRHIRKIYPIYFTMLVIGIPYEILTGVLKYGYQPVIQTVRCILFFFIDLTVLQSSSGSMMLSHSLNGVCWFLSCLFCIYIISPSILQLIKRKINSVYKSIICIIISVASSVVISIPFSYIDASTLFFDDLCYGSPYRRAFYVVTGMFLGNIFYLLNADRHKSIRFFNSGLFEYVSVGLSVIWYLIRQVLLSHMTALYLVDMILVSCDIFALAIGKGRISSFFRKERMIFLGNISMYIFVTHYLIRGYVDLIVQVLNIQNVVIGIMEIIISLLLTFMVSVHLYKKSGRSYLFDKIVDRFSVVKK